ncbi:MAG: hypothetical protein BGO01_04130 [Armatimonadetes bacterium 55-13]|nr:hypothetical protein [Armatimonadota bacterium]OJU63337.1 MAG: hypothetical protein BGO01_04130 [Armatimonadetes bacterium 55-13]
MKIRSSAKIAIGFCVLLGASYFGWKAYTEMTVMKIKFPPVKPGRVNIVGIETGKGYHILVANQAAQLIRGGVGQFQGDSGPDSSSEVEKKRVPIREMLQALQGDQQALGQFIAIMNDMQETDDWPTQRVVWKDADLRKAIDGSDPSLRKKLEDDINVHLDGTPLDHINTKALENGIILESTVPCRVQIGSESKQMTGPIQIPYRPKIAKLLEQRLKDQAYDEQKMANYYADEGRKILSGEVPKSDAGKEILDLINPKRLANLAAAAESVLQSAQVVCTDAYISKASYKNYMIGSQRLNDLSIELTDEGRNRLWQYSHNRVGSQLLLTVDGVAIAAPRIQHELAQGQLDITQLPDEILVQDAVKAINTKN